MAAPVGNQFWKMRSKHGREKLFASPELMWEAACEYFKWVDENPLTKPDYVGKDGEKVTRDLGRPYTIHALCLYMNVNTAYFRTFKAQLPDDEKEFNTVIHAIEETIYNQKFEGASVGIFNHNIIARDLGLADKREDKVEGSVKITGMKVI